MIINNVKGSQIVDFESWKFAFIEVDRDLHWKEGRSAYSLAYDFSYPSINESNGVRRVIDTLQAFGLENINLQEGLIEYESKFDAYRNGRKQDLILFGETSKSNLVVCIEAKVDEPFGESLVSAYQSAIDELIEKPKSQKKQRIDSLLARFYPTKAIEEIGLIRYQLLYFLAGSLGEAKKRNAVVYMPVMVYHTKDFDKSIGKQNKEDYIRFMKSLGFEERVVGNEILYSNTVEDILVLSSYMEINLM